MPSEVIALLAAFAIGLNALVIAISLAIVRGRPAKAKAATSAAVLATVPKQGAFKRFRKWLKKDIKDIRSEQAQEQPEEGAETGSSGGMPDW